MIFLDDLDYLIIGRAYRDGKGVEMNLDKAAEWMRLAFEKDIAPADNELFDILWKIDTPDSRSEMINVATMSAKSGNGEAIGRLACAYRDGRGVECDLIKASELMREASNKDIGWAKNELFDMLWTFKTPETDQEMISVISSFANTGDGNAMLRMGRAYREGRGVKQDMAMAIDWMRKASDKNISSAKIELSDILWHLGTPDSLDEMIDILMTCAESGDGNCMALLARAYYEGKGIEKNLDLAAEWICKASDHDVAWAKKEAYRYVWDACTVNKDIPFFDENSYVNDINTDRSIDSTNTVLFNLTHTGYLWNLIAIRFKCHPHQKCILFIGDYAKKNSFIESLKYNKIFDDVIYYDSWKITLLDSETKVIESLNNYFFKIMNDNGLDIHNLDSIYTGGDLVNSYALFLSINNINYYTIEWSPNQLFKIGRYYWGSKFASPARLTPLPFYILQKKYNVLCQENSNRPVVFSEKCNLNNLHDRSNYNLVNFKQMLLDLSDESKTRIASCIPDINLLSKDTVLVLPSSLDPSTRYYKKEKYAYVYQIFLDYYTGSNDDILIKCHPSNPNALKGYVPDAMLINGEYPIQLLEIVPGLKIKTICGVYSESIRSMTHIASKSFEAGEEYFRLFSKIHQIYAINYARCVISGSNSKYVQNYTTDNNFTDIFVSNSINVICNNPIGANFYMGSDENYPTGDTLICIIYSDNCHIDCNFSHHYIIKLTVNKDNEESLAENFTSYIHILSNYLLNLVEYFPHVKILNYSKASVTMELIQ